MIICTSEIAPVEIQEKNNNSIFWCLKGRMLISDAGILNLVLVA